MAIYSVGRRRIILAILLTCVLLLVLDQSGNPIINRLRDGAAIVMRPVDIASDVVTTPIVRGWRAYSEFDDIENENLALREENDRLRGTQASAEATIRDFQELTAVADLPSLAGIETELAQVVGRSATNLDEIVEINKGSLSGIAVGMPVVNQAGLIGRVTFVSPTTARIRLITDREFSVPVEILVGTADDSDDEPVTTTPSGLTPDEIDDIVNPPTTTTTIAPDLAGDTPAVDGETGDEGTETTTGTTLPETPAPDLAPSPATPVDSADDDPGTILIDPLTGQPIATDAVTGEPVTIDPITGQPITTDPITGQPITTDPITGQPVITDPVTGEPVAVDPATGEPIVTTTTTPFVLAEKEFGVLFGNGRGRVPQIQFVQDNPALTVLGVGDLVETAGGSTSLAPQGIPIGRVVNRVDRPGVGGPLLEVEPLADVTRLNFVQVVLFRPLSEVGG